MSFITKRERVFNSYELYELPPRNEGKLKAYSSCTDTRAWSHYCSDKTEHLIDIIKRNNEMCRPKYIPTEVIVDTIMGGKNHEISRLKRKIEEFEQMIAAYDNLELTKDQKAEIAKAHAAIKEANKDLDDLFFDMDLSGFTEGVDSEAFATGQSRGDESLKSKGDEWHYEGDKPTKHSQSGPDYPHCTGDPCDVSTMAALADPKLKEMEDTLVTKDAKLGALQNTIAVMENDVCEPYCLYAHIYTALEKIIATLCQNDKYKLYLDLMTSGKDTTCIDIKGKILFKLKVLEKFSMALVAPCTTAFSDNNNSAGSREGCSCYRAEISTRLDTFTVTSAEAGKPLQETIRSQLVADIMDNEDIKDMFNDSFTKSTDTDEYNLDAENLKRLKNLQENYDDLLNIYESLKTEKDNLQNKCTKYDEMLKDYNMLKTQLSEYNILWSEKEHYRRRSVDLDDLKEQFLVLSEETSNIELQLKAESVINEDKTKTIEELRDENLLLERKLNEAYISFEKDRNSLRCKLKECECKEMCQDQQIKVLSVQIDRLLEQEAGKSYDHPIDRATELKLNDEINSLREEINHLKHMLIGREEEKHQLQESYKENLNLINKLKMDIEHWKSSFEKLHERNDYLEKYVSGLLDTNNTLSNDVADKTKAIENLLNVINGKSVEINKLVEDMERKNKENRDLCDKIITLQETYNRNISNLDMEKSEAMASLATAKKESNDLLEKVKSYSDIVFKTEDLSMAYQKQSQECEQLKALLNQLRDENKMLGAELKSHLNQNVILNQRIEHLEEANNYATNNLNTLSQEKQDYEESLTLARKESKILEERLQEYEDLTWQLRELREAHDGLIHEKERLLNELRLRSIDLDNAVQYNTASQRQSEELINKLHQSESSKLGLLAINDAYSSAIADKDILRNELNTKENEFKHLLQSFKDLQSQNEQKSMEMENLRAELSALKNAYDRLLVDNNRKQQAIDIQTLETNKLFIELKDKMEETQSLTQKVQSLEHGHKVVVSDLDNLQKEYQDTTCTLDLLKRDSSEMINRLKNYEILEANYLNLKNAHDKLLQEKDLLHKELEVNMSRLIDTQRENAELNKHSQNLLIHSEDLENALTKTRTELIQQASTFSSPHEHIIKQIEDMSKDKLNTQSRIRDLLDKLERADNVIADLNQELSARKDRIAIMENHVNQLKDEIEHLHNSLASAVDTGDDLSVTSNNRIKESLQSMEAHHSRATHDMKSEIAKLNYENKRLVEQLSSTKLKKVESDHEKHKYLSRLENLQNERDILVTDIRDLEMKCTGDSELQPNQYHIENILASLDRVRGAFNSNLNKSTSLEEALLQLKDSTQLIQNKTDEAILLVEKEKQKILNEKEEAINERMNMEQELYNLRKQLESQASKYENNIKDLNSEIANRNLIIEKLQDSKQNYVAKLDGELKTIQDKYHELQNVNIALEERLKATSNESALIKDTLAAANRSIEEKSEEITKLRNQLKDLQSLLKKPHHRDIAIQVNLSSSTSKIAIQDDHDLNKAFIDTKVSSNENFLYNDKTDEKDKLKEKNLPLINVRRHKHHDTTNVATNERSGVLNEMNSNLINEVKILTANVNPSLDYVKNIYKNFKLHQLSTSGMEQYSFACPNDNDKMSTESVSIPNTSKALGPSNAEPKPTTSQIRSMNVIDIYNKQSLHTDSSKALDNYEINTKTSNDKSRIHEPKYESESDDIFKNKISSDPSNSSTNKDLFVIYKDSENNNFETIPDKNSQWTNVTSEILVEALTYKPHLKTKSKSIASERKTRESAITSDQYIYVEDDEIEEEDDSVKPKLDINIPRIDFDTHSIENSDTDKKSLDSGELPFYTNDFTNDKNLYNETITKSYSTHSLLNEEDQYLDSFNSTDEHKLSKNLKKTKKNANEPVSPNKNDSSGARKGKSHPNKDKNKIDQSHYKLSRVDADAVLIKKKPKPKTNADNSKRDTHRDDSFKSSKNGGISSLPSARSPDREKQINHGLDYIVESTQYQDDPEDLKTHTAAINLRRVKSDERYKQLYEDASPSLSEMKKSSMSNFKTSPSKSSERSEPKSYHERSVLAKLDNVEDYEKKISGLTKTLEEIEKDYKKKIEAIKTQYDNNIKNIINEHNQGVKSIQNLHEETLEDINKMHENEVENLRTMSIDAMRKAEKLERENQNLKTKVKTKGFGPDEEPCKIFSDVKKRRSRVESRNLTKTNIEAFNVKPKNKSQSICTCSLDINLSDTIRNLFEQVDVEQRKKAEQGYLKYIANKIMSTNIEALDSQELSFLHLKVCRIWKLKLVNDSKLEETFQKKIDTLETELLSKQRSTQHNIMELDRKVAEERRRLQEVREAVCRNTATVSKVEFEGPYSSSSPVVEKEFLTRCKCLVKSFDLNLSERRSAGDLAPNEIGSVCQKRPRNESNRAVSVDLDSEERRDGKVNPDEMPTRLRKYERSVHRAKK